VNKFGSEEKYNQITAHVTSVGATEGLQFNFSKQQKSPNTKDAHRLLLFARKYGKQIALKELLMQAYFEKGIDLTQKENLIALAVTAGLNAAEVSALLHSNEGTKEVDNLVQTNYQRGISGVPFYIINNQYGISGAQPTEVFVQALKQIGTELVKSEGDVCDVSDPTC
jgi:predicted DsbA family dithiol-disulfide isomerase